MDTNEETSNKSAISESSMIQSNLLPVCITPSNQIVVCPKNTIVLTLNANSIPSNNSVLLFNATDSLPNDKSMHKSKNMKKTHKNTFSAEEDRYLLSLVESFGENDWGIVSKFMNQMNYDKNIRQCRDRYYHYLDPKVDQLNLWTNEEDELLLAKVEIEGKKWKSFETLFKGKTEVSIRNRYNKLIRKKEKPKRKINIMSNDFSFLDSLFKKKKNNNETSKNDIDTCSQNRLTKNNYDSLISINNSENVDLSFYEENIESYFDSNDSFF